MAALFLRLGIIGFGGPAVHVALMRDEVVRRRRWVTDARFAELLGASNLIPGPTSTQLGIYLGYGRAGPWGLVAAGVCFILPAVLIVLAFAWVYEAFGSTPQAGWLLYGVKPTIISIVLYALVELGRSILKTRLLVFLAAAVAVLQLAGVSPLVLLLGAAAFTLLVRAGRGAWRKLPGLLAQPSIGMYFPAGVSGPTPPGDLGVLFLTFFKIGTVLYGGGYVLLAFLREDFVERLGWISDQQLLDAIAVGQFTPGPVFTTATFVGYLVGSWPGALLSTVAIFLPSFLLVAAVHPLLPRLRGSAWMGAFLARVNAAAIGLMAGVTVELGRSAIVDGFTLVLAGVALVALGRFRVNSAWLVAAGAAAGAGGRFVALLLG